MPNKIKRIHKLRKGASIRSWATVFAGLIIICLGIVTFFSPRLVPYSMDEFVGYQELACIVHPDVVPMPLASLESEGCHRYDLRLPKTTQWLPIRSYAYIGSLPSLVYAPFFYIIHSPISVRIQGLVFLILAVYLMSRLLRVRMVYVLLASMIFPMFAFSFIVDTGPIGLQTDLLIGVLLAIRSAYETRSPRVRDKYLLLGGVLAFLAFWIKPDFWWSLPIVVGYIFFRSYIRGSHLKKSLYVGIRSFLPFAVGFVPLTIILLLMVGRDGNTYAQYLASLDLHVNTFSQFIDGFKQLSQLIIHGNHISSIAVLIPTRIQDFIPIVISGLLFIIWAFRRGRHDINPLLLLASAVLVFIIAVFSDGLLTHHAVLPLVFLVMALASILANLPMRYVIIAGTITGLYWINLLTRIPSATVFYGDSSAKDHLLQRVWHDENASTTAEVNLYWGTYFISNLFSPPGQRVLYFNAIIEPMGTLINDLTTLNQDGVRKMVVTADSPYIDSTQQAFNKTFGLPLRSYREGNWSAFVYALPPAKP